MKPLAVDLFCGLGGWTTGLQAAGWDVIGFDIEKRHYPGDLALQDVSTIDAHNWRGKVQLIVASPPCQAYSYRAMPWKRAKALPPPDNSLFEHCFRIAAEAQCPIVVENVCGAQKWIGRAKWHYGSYYLWGDVPALMPHTFKAQKITVAGNGSPYGGNFGWDGSAMRTGNSHSSARKEASARIAMIPFALALHIGQVYYPAEQRERNESK